MSKRTAFIIAGVVTSIVMVLVLGVAGGTNWFGQRASAASTGDTTAAGSANPADVAALQAQLNDYQTALQQANAQLQAAYDEIAALQAQGRFSREREEYEQSGRFFNPFDND